MDVFELRVLDRLSPKGDVSTLQDAVESLRADIDLILEARVPNSEDPFEGPAEDTVMVALFTTSDISPPPPR